MRKLELSDKQLSKLSKLFANELSLNANMNDLESVVRKSFDFWNKKIIEFNNQFEETQKQIRLLIDVEKFAAEIETDIEKDKLLALINRLFALFESLKFGNLDFEERIKLISQEG